MQFRGLKENLLEGLSTATRALSTKNTEVFLQGVYLRAEKTESGERLLMAATDNEMRIEISVPVEVIEEGHTVLPGKELYQYIRKMPDVPLYFSHTSKNGNDTMVISYGDAKGVIKGFAGSEFPTKSKPLEHRHFAIMPEAFRDFFRYTEFTINPDELRPIFTGLKLELNDGFLTVVGTDSYRMAVISLLVDNLHGENAEAVVPLRFLREVDRLCNLYPEDRFKVQFGTEQVLFESDRTRLWMTTLRGDYPPYKRVIPTSSETFIKVDRKKFIDSLERASLFSRLRDGTTVCKFNIDGNVLSIHAESEQGSVDEYIDIYMEGPSLDITFNARFILDALKAFEADTIEMNFNGSSGGMVMRTQDKKDYLYLLLPLRR